MHGSISCYGYHKRCLGIGNIALVDVYMCRHSSVSGIVMKGVYTCVWYVSICRG